MLYRIIRKDISDIQTDVMMGDIPLEFWLNPFVTGTFASRHEELERFQFNRSKICMQFPNYDSAAFCCFWSLVSNNFPSLCK